MTMNGDIDNIDDETLLEVLRSGLPPSNESLDIDPAEFASLVDGAMWVHDWHNMDTELAELTFDSDQRTELAGVRSPGSLRDLTFVSNGHLIELELTPSTHGADIRGAVAPTRAKRFQLVVGGDVFSGDIDEHGSFAILAVPHGTALAFIELNDAIVRLGSFEI